MIKINWYTAEAGVPSECVHANPLRYLWSLPCKGTKWGSLGPYGCQDTAVERYMVEFPWWSSGQQFDFQCSGCEFSPWSRNWDPTCLPAKKPKHKSNTITNSVKTFLKNKIDTWRVKADGGLDSYSISCWWDGAGGDVPGGKEASLAWRTELPGRRSQTPFSRVDKKLFLPGQSTMVSSRKNQSPLAHRDQMFERRVKRWWKLSNPCRRLRSGGLAKFSS